VDACYHDGNGATGLIGEVGHNIRQDVLNGNRKREESKSKVQYVKLHKSLSSSAEEEGDTIRSNGALGSKSDDLDLGERLRWVSPAPFDYTLSANRIDGPFRGDPAHYQSRAYRTVESLLENDGLPEGYDEETDGTYDRGESLHGSELLWSSS
jgi:hypothetical protein